MKLYISADIEGIVGITHWDEADKHKPDYQEFRDLMTETVIAACEGAIAAGVDEIYVKDAHESGRNLWISDLPDCVHLIRGWSGHPFCMIQELDSSFDAAIMLGYHSPAGSDTNPLAHTLSIKKAHLKINGELASEFTCHTYAAALVKVPVVYVSGDQGLCESVQQFNPNMQVLAVHRAIGDSTISMPYQKVINQLREGVCDALKSDISACQVTLPDTFDVEIKYRDPVSAYQASFYPGMESRGPQIVGFQTQEYFEVLRMLQFVP